MTPVVDLDLIFSFRLHLGPPRCFALRPGVLPVGRPWLGHRLIPKLYSTFWSDRMFKCGVKVYRVGEERAYFGTGLHSLAGSAVGIILVRASRKARILC